MIQDHFITFVKKKNGDTLTIICDTHLLPSYTNVTRGHMTLTTTPSTLFHMRWNY